MNTNYFILTVKTLSKCSKGTYWLHFPFCSDKQNFLRACFFIMHTNLTVPNIMQATFKSSKFT